MVAETCTWGEDRKHRTGNSERKIAEPGTPLWISDNVMDFNFLI